MAVNNFFWDLPTKIVFGPGAIKEIRKSYIKELLPGSRALIVSSAGNSLKSAGILKDVTHALEGADISADIYDGVTPNPVLSEVVDGIEMLRNGEYDFIVAAGGGSVMDAAQAMAGLANEEGDDIWRYFFTGDKKPLKREAAAIPIVKIPTTASTGEETSNRAYIINEETEQKGIFEGEHPLLAVIDPELHVTLTPEFSALHGFAALIQGMEGYISKKRTAPAQMMHIATLGNIAQFLPVVIEDGADMDAREKLAFAGAMSGMSAQLGSSTGLQQIARVLTAHYRNMPHGAALAILCEEFFGYFTERHCCDDIFTELAMSIGRAPTDTNEILNGLADLKEQCGLAQLRLSDYGVKEEELVTFAKEAYAGRGEFFRNDPLPMSENDILKLLEKCL